MTHIIVKLSWYCDIKFPNEHASHPSQETAINTELQLKKDKKLQQKDRQLNIRKDLKPERFSNPVYQFEDILSEISTIIDRIGFVKLMEQ